MTWSHEHFTGVDWDARSKTSGVFRLTGHPHQGWSQWVDKVLIKCAGLARAHHRLVLQENGNYDYLLGIDVCDVPLTLSGGLMDLQIDHRHPDVRSDLFAWSDWVLEVGSMESRLVWYLITRLQTTNAGGYRLDAIKHMDRRFLREFVRSIILTFCTFSNDASVDPLASSKRALNVVCRI
jgi:alpha-amylase